MLWINRVLSGDILESAELRPAIVITGARQTGKSSLVKHVFPDGHFVTLDHVAEARLARENPRGFLQKHAAERVLIDEIQYAPDLLREIKVSIDENRTAYGRWIITGGQRFDMMTGVGESLAGRVRLLELGTLGATELRSSEHVPPETIRTLPWRGGYPELWSNRRLPTPILFEDYIATYLNRDLREIVAVRDAGLFYRFLTTCAMRAGSLLNYENLARKRSSWRRLGEHGASGTDQGRRSASSPPRTGRNRS